MQATLCLLVSFAAPKTNPTISGILPCFVRLDFSTQNIYIYIYT